MKTRNVGFHQKDKSEVELKTKQDEVLPCFFLGRVDKLSDVRLEKTPEIKSCTSNIFGKLKASDRKTKTFQENVKSAAADFQLHFQLQRVQFAQKNIVELQVISKFTEKFSEVFCVNKARKAHLDCLGGSDDGVINGAQSPWIPLLLLDAILSSLEIHQNQYENRRLSRRIFDQHQILSECILQCLDTEVHGENSSADMPETYIVLTNEWQTFAQLQALAQANTPVKSKAKFIRTVTTMVQTFQEGIFDHLLGHQLCDLVKLTVARKLFLKHGVHLFCEQQKRPICPLLSDYYKPIWRKKSPMPAISSTLSFGTSSGKSQYNVQSSHAAQASAKKEDAQSMLWSSGSQVSNKCEAKSSVTESKQTSSDFQQNSLLSTKSSSSMLSSFQPRLCASNSTSARSAISTSSLFKAKQPSLDSVSAVPNVPSVSRESLPSAVAKRVSQKRKASFQHNNDEECNWPRPVSSWEADNEDAKLLLSISKLSGSQVYSMNQGCKDDYKKQPSNVITTPSKPKTTTHTPCEKDCVDIVNEVTLKSCIAQGNSMHSDDSFDRNLVPGSSSLSPSPTHTSSSSGSLSPTTTTSSSGFSSSSTSPLSCRTTSIGCNGLACSMSSTSSVASLSSLSSFSSSPPTVPPSSESHLNALSFVSLSSTSSLKSQDTAASAPFISLTSLQVSSLQAFCQFPKKRKTIEGKQVQLHGSLVTESSENDKMAAKHCYNTFMRSAFSNFEESADRNQMLCTTAS